MQIFVSGSLAYDRIMDFPEKFSDHILPDKIHILNVCFMVNGLKEQFGGTAGNIAYSLALLGEQPFILATAGKDFHSYRNWLTEHGLRLDAIRIISDEFTAGAYITTDKADNQITGFNPGAMKYPCLYPIDGAEPKRPSLLWRQGTSTICSRIQRVTGSETYLTSLTRGNPFPRSLPMRLIEALTGSRLFISNDYELEMVVRSTGMPKSDLLKKTGAVITTLGERGSLISTSEADVQVPAVPVERVLDPTGAGDALRAGLDQGAGNGKESAGGRPNGRGMCRLRSGMPGHSMPSLFSGGILGAL